MFELMKGDCLELMKQIPDESVDLFVSSPPYNIGKPYEKRSSANDYLLWHKQIVIQAERVLRDGGAIAWQVGNYIEKGSVFPIDCMVFGQFTDLGLRPRNRIIWTFGHGLHCSKRYSGRHETILLFTKGDKYLFNLDAVRVPQKFPGKRHYKGPKKGQLSGNPLGKNPGDVWDISNVKNNHPEKTPHPCQFPEAIAERLILSLSNEGDVVIDPFMGSGTTGAACANTGRNFIGIEMDEKYFEIAKNRVESAYSKNELEELK